MSNEISTAHAQLYKRGVMTLVQQTGSRLRHSVMVEGVSGSKRSARDQIGSVAAAKRTTRHQDTPITDTPHRRRWITIFDWIVADLLDREDLEKVVNDFRGPYAQAQGMALARSVDDVIIEAFGLAAVTGEDGTGSQAFDTTNQEIPISSTNFGGAANTALTLAKLIEARAILDGNDIDLDMEEVFLTATTNNVLNLLTTTQVTSADFNTVKALVTGKVDEFMGYKFIRSNRLLDNASDGTHVDCYAYVKSGMAMDMTRDLTVEMDKRPDKSNAWQIMATMGLGATRLEEARIVRIVNEKVA